MMFHVPPQNGGRIVEVSYAASNGKVIRKTHDRSDRTTVYHISTMLYSDEGDYWNGEPRNQRWRKMTRTDLAKYDLI